MGSAGLATGDGVREKRGFFGVVCSGSSLSQALEGAQFAFYACVVHKQLVVKDAQCAE